MKPTLVNGLTILNNMPSPPIKLGLIGWGLTIVLLLLQLSQVGQFHSLWIHLVVYTLASASTICVVCGLITMIHYADSWSKKGLPTKWTLPNQITQQYSTSLSERQKEVLEVMILQLSRNSNTTLFTKSTGANTTLQSQFTLGKMNGWMWEHGYMDTSMKLEELPSYLEIMEYIGRHLIRK